MSDLDSFTLFPELPFEIRLLIWESTLSPHIISLVPIEYPRGDQSRAVPWHLVAETRPGSYEGISARFSIPDVPSHAILHVSRESRNAVFNRGYRVWKMENQLGHTRNVVWHPDIDAIALPPKQQNLQSGQMNYHFYYPKLFSLQYPEETRIARNVALPTSLWQRSRYRWILWYGQLSNFKSLSQLIMVVDKEYERFRVECLITNQRASNRLGVFILPQEIEETFERGQQTRPNLVMNIPFVRVVGTLEGILKGEALQISLQCNPCEYLNMPENRIAEEAQ